MNARGACARDVCAECACACVCLPRTRVVFGGSLTMAGVIATLSKQRLHGRSDFPHLHYASDCCIGAWKGSGAESCGLHHPPNLASAPGVLFLPNATHLIQGWSLVSIWLPFPGAENPLGPQRPCPLA